MSFVSTHRNSSPAGDARSPLPNAKCSETSAPVAPPLSARASNSVTTVLTTMFSFFPAATAIARSVNPPLEIYGWNERLRNCCQFPAVTSFLRFRRISPDRAAEHQADLQPVVPLRFRDAPHHWPRPKPTWRSTRLSGRAAYVE